MPSREGLAHKLPQGENTVGRILPRALLTRLKVKLESLLCVTELPVGFQQTPYNLEFETHDGKCCHIHSMWQHFPSPLRRSVWGGAYTER